MYGKFYHVCVMGVAWHGKMGNYLQYMYRYMYIFMVAGWLAHCLRTSVVAR